MVYKTDPTESNTIINQKIEEFAELRKQLKTIREKIEQVREKLSRELKTHFNLLENTKDFHLTYRYKNIYTLSISKYSREKERLTFYINQ